MPDLRESQKKPVAFWASLVAVATTATIIGLNPTASDPAISGVAATIFAAFWIWLTVRIVNRREWWAIGLAGSTAIVTVILAIRIYRVLAEAG